MLSREELPDAECRFGYTTSQIEVIFPDQDARGCFYDWMREQTGAICDGKRWDNEACVIRETGCGPHGFVVYTYDVRRYVHMMHPEA